MREYGSNRDGRRTLNLLSGQNRLSRSFYPECTTCDTIELVECSWTARIVFGRQTSCPRVWSTPGMQKWLVIRSSGLTDPKPTARPESLAPTLYARDGFQSSKPTDPKSAGRPLRTVQRCNGLLPLQSSKPTDPKPTGRPLRTTQRCSGLRQLQRCCVLQTNMSTDPKSTKPIQTIGPTLNPKRKTLDLIERTHGPETY